MNHRLDELAKELVQSTTLGKALRKFGVGLAGMALVWVGGITAWAGWTPPESSVTPPAVLTLDAFGLPNANGANPSVALVVGPDGALYGSTGAGGTNNYGTLFRIETNGAFTKLLDFNGTDGANPSEALVVGPDGALYGSTQYGGTNGNGTLFRIETNGTFTKLHDFNGIGSDFPSPLVVGPDEALYGSTFSGGTTGNGTLFRLETNGTFTKLHDLDYTNDGSSPFAAMVIGPDGALYGSTSVGGTSIYGTLFRLQTNGTFTKLHDFNGLDGALPSAALVVGPDGALYGSAGTLFRLETNGAFTKLHDFNGADGASPYAALVVGPDGAMYGSTEFGGTGPYSGNGTLFRLQTNGTFTKLHDFNGADGANPFAALVVGPDGALYGPAPNLNVGNGTLFRLETNGTFTLLQAFNGTNGSYPAAMLVVGPDGAIYGSTENGSARGYGTLFRLETNGLFTKLHDFLNPDGYQPSAALVLGPDSALYGSTQFGGAVGNGTLFRLEADGTFTRLHDFEGTNGASQSAALVVGPDGALYGSTANSGANYFGYGYGMLFRLETNGTFTKLHDFDVTNGAYPLAALVLGPDGALYGSTQFGGAGPPEGNGTLFRVETNGTFAIQHYFSFTDGYYPSAAMVVGPDGGLYGLTPYGGGCCGTLFRLGTNGAFSELQDFNGTNGGYPFAPLVVGPDGALYGSTQVDGAGPYAGSGTLFRLETSGTLTKLQDFNGTNGSNPYAALVVGLDGALYGSTQFGGTNDDGTLFRLETDGSFTKLHDFNGADGYHPSAALVVGPDGALYGSTQYGGTNGNGTLFRLGTNGTFAKLYDFNGANGSYPSSALVVGPDGALYGSAPNDGPRGGGILFKLVLNRPPVARCHDVTVSAGANCAADASVDNGSFDPDAGDTITLRQEPPGPYPMGVTPVTLIVTDNHGASNSCTATVTVTDTTPPTISDVAVTPNVLWPPNNKMVDVTVSYTATDDCGGVTNVLVVSSNEATNGPAPDWVIEDEHHIQLRAERSGSGGGRVYTITVISTDNAGNSSTKSTTVSVPRSKGK